MRTTSPPSVMKLSHRGHREHREKLMADELTDKIIVIKGQRLDLLVEGQVVVELKAVARLPDVELAQALSYLKATGLKHALLLNFGQQRLVDGIKRVPVTGRGMAGQLNGRLIQQLSG
jgi:GxxExxY protein